MAGHTKNLVKMWISDITDTDTEQMYLMWVEEPFIQPEVDSYLIVWLVLGSFRAVIPRSQNRVRKGTLPLPFFFISILLTTTKYRLEGNDFLLVTILNIR